MIKVPNTWDSIEHFAIWYKQNSYPIRPPADARVYVTEHTYSFVIFRQGRFQAEMYFAKPNTISTKHTHPFSQIMLFMGGEISGTRELKDWSTLGGSINNIPEPDKPHPDFGRMTKRLDVGEWHQLQTYDRGFAFIVLQEWKDGKPTSAVVAYDGESLGDQHTELMSAYRNKNVT